VNTEARVTRVGEIVHEAAETHHVVYRIANGADGDWASWYGDWLVRLSELPQGPDVTPLCIGPVYLLVRLVNGHEGAEARRGVGVLLRRAIVEHFSAG
jgi:hypothetical protein